MLLAHTLARPSLKKQITCFSPPNSGGTAALMLLLEPSSSGLLYAMPRALSSSLFLRQCTILSRAHSVKRLPTSSTQCSSQSFSEVVLLLTPRKIFASNHPHHCFFSELFRLCRRCGSALALSHFWCLKTCQQVLTQRVQLQHAAPMVSLQ